MQSNRPIALSGPSTVTTRPAARLSRTQGAASGSTTTTSGGAPHRADPAAIAAASPPTPACT